MEKIVTDSNFAEVIRTDRLVMVDFWATWCNPCRMLAPVVEEIADEYKDRIVVGKCDVDENPEVTSALRIMSIPALIFFKNGEIVKTAVGYKEKEDLKEIIDSLL